MLTGFQITIIFFLCLAFILITVLCIFVCVIKNKSTDAEELMRKLDISYGELFRKINRETTIAGEGYDDYSLKETMLLILNKLDCKLTTEHSKWVKKLVCKTKNSKKK